MFACYDKKGPIWPLVPEETAKLSLNIMNNKHQKEVAIQEHSKSEAEEMQLPIQRIMPYPLLQAESVSGQGSCALCEYLLHYIQDVLTNPTTEVIKFEIFKFLKFFYI